MNSIRLDRISPMQIIPLSFLFAILAGTALLMLPCATAPGEQTGVLTALFTATTSICVTGLVVVNTYSHWTLFGQWVILFLIQIGGLGVVSVGALVMLAGRRKLTFGDRKLLGDSLNVEQNKGLLSYLVRIFRGTMLVEGVGALCFAVRFVPMFGWGPGLWSALFQAVSAFCNAGMDVIGPDSMTDFRDSAFLMGVTMALIILGGLGYVVWFNLVDRLKTGIKHRLGPDVILRHLSEHSKLVLIVTAVLILFGAAGIFVMERNNPATMAGLSLYEKILNSMFQSVTFRTAGFASVPQDGLTEASCVLGCILMFFGGSPMGTAGGVKTVTAFLVAANAVQYIKGNKETVVFKRKVPGEMIRKAAAIVFVNFCVIVVMTLLLMTVCGVNLVDSMYEVTSAVGTVGLSRNLTPDLDAFGRIVIITSMYLGRIGPISMAYFFTWGLSSKSQVRHANGNFFVG